MILITMKDGTIHKFEHQGRAGGSYRKKLTFEAAFAIVTDEWGKRIAFPAADIAKIEDSMNVDRGW